MADKRVGDGTGMNYGSVPSGEGDEWTGTTKPNSDAGSPSQMGGTGPSVDGKEVGGGNRSKPL